MRYGSARVVCVVLSMCVSLRCCLQVRMHASMGLDLIRVWGGGLSERPEFYDAADELGVLVMQVSWVCLWCR